MCCATKKNSSGKILELQLRDAHGRLKVRRGRGEIDGPSPSGRRMRRGIIKTLLLATSAVMPRLKYIICVDDDIDIYNLTDVMWAVATRCDPKDDVASVDGTMTSWLDPSSGGLTGKLFFDATKKEGFRGQMPEYPEESMVRARKAIEIARALASHVASN